MASYELEGYYFYNSLDSRFSAPYGNAYGDWYKFKASIPEKNITPEYDRHFGKIYSSTHSGDSFYVGSGAYELTRNWRKSYGSSYLTSFDITQYYDKETDSLFTDNGVYAFNGITTPITTLSGYGGLGGESGYMSGRRFSPLQEWDKPFSFTTTTTTSTSSSSNTSKSSTPASSSSSNSKTSTSSTPASSSSSNSKTSTSSTPASSSSSNSKTSTSSTPASSSSSNSKTSTTSDSSEGKDIYGSKKSNRLRGTNNDDYIDGGKGNDNINGLNGDDIIIGGMGRDTIYTGDGADLIVINKKLGKGNNNWDLIMDFTKGEDYLYIEDKNNKKYKFENDKKEDLLYLWHKNNLIAGFSGINSNDIEWDKADNGYWIVEIL